MEAQIQANATVVSGTVQVCNSASGTTITETMACAATNMVVRNTTCNNSNSTINPVSNQSIFVNAVVTGAAGTLTIGYTPA